MAGILVSVITLSDFLALTKARVKHYFYDSLSFDEALFLMSYSAKVIIAWAVNIIDLIQVIRFLSNELYRARIYSA